MDDTAAYLHYTPNETVHGVEFHQIPEVTVPLVAALGLRLAETIPGRSALLDGFGLIAFATLFPMITVMAYAQISVWRTKRAHVDFDEPEN